MTASPELQIHLDMLQGFGSVYIGVLVMGLFYGLTMCNFSCIPLIGPYIFGTQGGVQGGFRRGFDATAIFVLTRIVTYTLLGGLSGLVGSVALESLDAGWLLTAAGGLILVIGARVVFKSNASCQKSNEVQGPERRTWVHMMTLGFSTSLMPCLPLTAVLLYAATTQSFLTGCALALMFGIGTSASPLYYIGGATGWLAQRIRNEAPRFRGALRTISGLILAIFGIRLLLMGGILV
jgi:thiol:disulfide interchange protein DsbD